KKAGEGLSDRLVQKTVKFGGGFLMIWGCMTWEGILEDKLQQTFQYYGLSPDDIIFQQDNDPKHTSRRAKQ
ncbi:hypothetical protein SERLADRAFT_346281, partial [Serpula lacrymans var. lacrymans S7.9]